MECALCRSTDLQKLSVIYDAGLSDLKGYSTGLLDGGFYLHRGRGQSRLSRLAAPPKKQSYVRTALPYALCFYIVGALVSLMMAHSLPQPHQIIHTSAKDAHATVIAQESSSVVFGNILAIVFLAGLTMFLQRVFRYNRKIYPAALQIWNSSFMCRRCGAIMQMQTQPAG